MIIAKLTVCNKGIRSELALSCNLSYLGGWNCEMVWGGLNHHRKGFCDRIIASLHGEGQPRRKISYDERRVKLHAAPKKSEFEPQPEISTTARPSSQYCNCKKFLKTQKKNLLLTIYWCTLQMTVEKTFKKLLLILHCTIKYKFKDLSRVILLVIICSCSIWAKLSFFLLSIFLGPTVKYVFKWNSSHPTV